MTPWELALVIGSAVLAAAAVVMSFVIRARTGKQRAAKSVTGEAHLEAPTGAAGIRPGQICDDIRDLMAQLDRLAQQIDGRIEHRLEEVQKLLAAADERVAQLRAMVDAPQATTPAIKMREGINVEVLRLHRQGVDSVEIARNMRMDVGEVELILSLQKTQRLKQA